VLTPSPNATVTLSPNGTLSPTLTTSSTVGTGSENVTTTDTMGRLTTTSTISHSRTRIPIDARASSAFTSLLNALAALGLYSQASCMWPLLIALAFFITVFSLQALYVAYHAYFHTEINLDTQDVPLWRSLLLSMPYAALFVPCHYRCALGHTLNALLHFLVHMIFVLTFRVTIAKDATVLTQILLFVIAAMIACSYQPLFQLAFYWSTPMTTSIADAEDIIKERDAEERAVTERLDRRASRRQRKSLTFAKDNVLEHSNDTPEEKVITMDDLYELDASEAVKPFFTEDDPSDPWNTTTSGGGFAPDYDDDTVFADGTMFAIFDDLDDAAWQPNFVKLTDDERLQRVELAMAGMADAEHRPQQEDAALDRIALAFDLMEFPVSESSDAEPEEQPVPMFAGNDDGFLENPDSGAVFSVFDEMDEGLAARELHAPEVSVREQAPSRRAPPVLPSAPPPPRFFKYLQSSSPSANRSETASVVEQSQDSGFVPAPRTFLDDVLDDLDSDEDERNERVQRAMEQSEQDSQAEIELFKEHLVEEQISVALEAQDNADLAIDIYDGPLVVEVLTTRQQIGTILLGLAVVVLLLLLYVFSSTQWGSQICQSDLSLGIAVLLDVLAQCLIVLFTWLYRYLQSSDGTKQHLRSALHPYHGEKRATVL
jgi:hypothetical protein